MALRSLPAFGGDYTAKKRWVNIPFHWVSLSGICTKNFNRQKYLEIAKSLKIPAKTAEGYITSFVKSNLLHREQQDNYINLSIEETKEVEEHKED